MWRVGKLFFIWLSLSFVAAKWAHGQHFPEPGMAIPSEFESETDMGYRFSKEEKRHQRGRSQDSPVIERNVPPDPIKAALLSAALPGLGQIYNRSYWKVPIVYGSLMTFGYLVHFFDYNYIKYRNAFLAANDGNPNTINPYEGDRRVGSRLFDRVEFYRRNRDYLMILTAGFYLLNIVEAHVDAHLQTFDLSDDISMNIRPKIISSPHSNLIGLSINFTIK
jgi:hypothetical protein